MELSGQLHASSTLLPGKQSLVHIGWGAWWAPESVWTRWWREKFPAHPRSGTPDHPALYHWAIPAPAFNAMILCSFVVCYQCFRGPCCLHLRDKVVGLGKNDYIFTL